MRISRLPHWLGEASRYVALHAARPRLRDSAQPTDPEIVVALTTIPSRIQALDPTLRSLVDQTVRPSKIVLSLPAYSRRQQREYRIPDRVRRHPLVSVLDADRDWGPATKLIPALQHLAHKPDALVVVVDDDNVYPRTFVETLVRHAGMLPDAAIGLRGWLIPPSFRWRERRTIVATDLTAPVRTDVLEGCGGMLVRPRFFDAALCEPTGPALFADDVWISGHLARSRVPAYVVPYPGACIHLGSMAGLLGPALNRTENRDGVHETALIEHFREHWLSIGKSR